MNCEQIREMLDAYALGAADAAEAGAIEAHVADCVRCWEELSKAQQTAALVALASPLSEPPPALESRIMQAAAAERPAVRAAREPRRIRLGWPAAAGALGVVAAAALAFASYLQIQMNDLRNDKDALAQELGTTQDVLEDQAQVIAISAAEDRQVIDMEGVLAPEGAWGEYVWSRSAGGGFIICHGMPAPAEGEVYQAWFVLDDRQVSAGTFAPSEDGRCVYPMDPAEPVRGARAVAVSQEQAGGSDSPSGDWLIYASFERD
jgi:anti-sigma-K factor RskA